VLANELSRPGRPRWPTPVLPSVGSQLRRRADGPVRLAAANAILAVVPTITSAEVFTLSHVFSPRRGPADAWGSTHAYCLVKLSDADGVAGWGETYLRPGMAPILAELVEPLVGRSPAGVRAAWDDIWASGEYPFAASALAIAPDDLRGRQAGVSIADLYGGRRRDRVRAYAAHQGYMEGVDPEVLGATTPSRPSGRASRR
jgi:L-alanine-DL-glutamate epimerase-like enolase superfamily enzyme